MPGRRISDENAPAFSAGVVIVRKDGAEWRVLILRAYRNWDFPKGLLERGEAPIEAAVREAEEETALRGLAFNWGDASCESAPYSRGKIARYYIAETHEHDVILPVSPELGRPENDEWRWASFDEAASLLPARLQPILGWAKAQLEASARE